LTAREFAAGGAFPFAIDALALAGALGFVLLVDSLASGRLGFCGHKKWATVSVAPLMRCVKGSLSAVAERLTLQLQLLEVAQSSLK
jgi:hypothetical protein